MNLANVNEVILAATSAISLSFLVLSFVDLRRGGAVGLIWLVLTALFLVGLTVPAYLWTYDHTAADHSIWWKLTSTSVALLPWSLYRYVRAVTLWHARIRHLPDIGLVGLVAFYAWMPTLPGALYTPLPWYYIAVTLMLATYFVLATIAIALAVRAASRAQPRAAQMRGTMIVLSVAVFSFSVVLWLSAPNEITDTLTNALIALSCILLILVVRSPEHFIRWAAPELVTLRSDAVHQLMASRNLRADLSNVLQAISDAGGFVGVGVILGNGTPLECIGSCPIEEGTTRTTNELVAASPGDGASLVAWTTPLTPPPTASDIAYLSSIASLIDTALSREDIQAAERKAIEREAAAARALEQAVEQMKEADAIKERFVALVSHELRTPLTSIIGLARTARDRWDQLDNQQLIEFQSVIVQQGERLARIVEDLLMVSQIEQSGITVTAEDLDIEDAISTAILDAGIHDGDEMTIDCQVSTITADARLLHEILVNYISNALKYGKPPFIVRVEQDEQQIRITVIDHGSGVGGDVEHRLFDRFARSADTSHVTGSGLGLAIVRDLAAIMGGETGYDRSDVNTSNFWLTIPRRDIVHLDERD